MKLVITIKFGSITYDYMPKKQAYEHIKSVERYFKKNKCFVKKIDKDILYIKIKNRKYFIVVLDIGGVIC